MKRRIFVFGLTMSVLPSLAMAQEPVNPVERLEEVLPESVVDEVLARVNDAMSRGLPGEAMANLALEGVVKGRSGEEVLAAVTLLANEMATAAGAFARAGHAPGDGEVEAATAAMRMGVDGEAVSALASSAPSGRSLAVPLLVLGGLAERGLPSDAAVAAVQERLAAHATDSELVGTFPEAAQALGRSMRPDQVGPALASGVAGFQVPVAGITVPVGGPPREIPRPGRPNGN
jgi:hypothetical protein